MNITTTPQDDPEQSQMHAESQTPSQSKLNSKPWIQTLGITLGLPIIIALMLLAFLAPTFNSGPQHLPLAIAGPEPALDNLTNQLDSRQPNAFEIQQLDGGASVEEHVHNREAIGGLVFNPTDQSVTVYTASGNGTPYTTVLNKLADVMRAQGTEVEVIDLAPMNVEDPQGSAFSILGLPLAFGGMVSAAVMTSLLKGRPWHKIIASLGMSLLAGFVAAAILIFGYGAIEANFLTISIAIAAGIAAISLVVAGLGSWIGFSGVAIGGIVTIFFANPLSGLATGWWWLPSPWGALGQWMPIGADGYLLRSIAFFDGADSARPIMVLISWILVGLILLVSGGIRNQKNLTKHSDRNLADAA
ncbi:ABC transporter permease [Corynebacterium propinquum]